MIPLFLLPFTFEKLSSFGDNSFSNLFDFLLFKVFKFSFIQLFLNTIVLNFIFFIGLLFPSIKFLIE